MQFTHLRSMAALFQPPKNVTESHSSNFDGLKQIVNEAMEDLESKLGKNGVLEAMMKSSGLDAHDTFKDHDGYTILQRLQTRTQQYQDEIEKGLEELEVMFIGLGEGKNLEEGLAVGETIKYSGVEYKSLGPVKGDKLAKDMMILGVSGSSKHGHNNFFTVVGFTDSNISHSETPVFDTVKEVYEHEGVTSLKALNDKQDQKPYGKCTYMVCEDLKDGMTFTAYLYKGRWSVGSGADPLSCTRIEKA
jgi:hypothetical protein